MTQTTEAKEMKETLTVLSFGGGQDSTALAYKLVYDADFRAKYAPGRILVIMSDTNDEHKETLANVATMKTFFAANRIEFVHLTNDMGFHSPAWQGLREFYYDRFQQPRIRNLNRFAKVC